MIDKKALLAALDEYEPAEEYEYEHDLWLDIHILVASFEETECHCNLKKNAELIAKILDSDSNNEIYIDGRAFNISHCSVCNEVPCGVDEHTNYCPNCGAKMDEEATE